MWPVAVFVVVFEVFGTMIVFLVIIELVALLGWLPSRLT
jgi:F0F1-type ATP synthase membrane subunit c/vacuolar-type H+-ATPase subunit K